MISFTIAFYLNERLHYSATIRLIKLTNCSRIHFKSPPRSKCPQVATEDTVKSYLDRCCRRVCTCMFCRRRDNTCREIPHTSGSGYRIVDSSVLADRDRLPVRGGVFRQPCPDLPLWRCNTYTVRSVCGLYCRRHNRHTRSTADKSSAYFKASASVVTFVNTPFYLVAISFCFCSRHISAPPVIISSASSADISSGGSAAVKSALSGIPSLSTTRCNTRRRTDNPP